MDVIKNVGTSSSHVGWLRGWVSSCTHSGGSLHCWSSHLGSHDWSRGGLRSSSGNIGVGFLELGSLNGLLVVNFLLDVLISLKEFVVLGLSKLQSLVQVGLELLLEGVHLVLLLLNELGLGSNDLLLSFLHVLLSFLNLKFGCLLLNLMGFGIFLLFGKTGLDSLQV